MTFPGTRLVLFACLSLVCAFSFSSAVASASSPGQVEYGYQNIPDPGGKGNTNNSNGTNTNTNGNEATASSTDDGGSTTGSSTGSTTGSSTGSVNGGKSGSKSEDLSKLTPEQLAQKAKQVNKQRLEKLTGADSQKAEKTALPTSVTGEDSDSGHSSLFLILALIAIAIGFVVVIVMRRRKNSAWTSAASIFAVTAMALALVGTGAGKAVAAQRAAVPSGFFGIVDQDTAVLSGTKRMDKGGIEQTRLPVYWSQIQPNNSSQFLWGTLDDQIRASVDGGLQVLPYIDSTPQWVSKKTTTLPTSGKAATAWKTFVKALVERYGPNGDFWEGTDPDSTVPDTYSPIRTWQIWNEVNFFYFASPVSAPTYAKLLKITTPTIKSVDPGAKIMLSGLYGSPKGPASKAQASNEYLAKLYKAGAAKYFDSAALHPYSPNTSQLGLLTDNFRKVMINNGDRSTPLNITELGWGSSSSTVFGQGSPAKQAKQLTSGYDYLIDNRRKLNLRSIFWFSWKDQKKSQATCNFCYDSGLFKAGKSLTPKPAWNAFLKFSGGK